MTGITIPFVDLRPGEDADAINTAIDRVVQRGWYVLGPEVDAFEREFASACGSPHAVGTGNGTDALAIILRALGIGPGDEVITTPLSAAFTAIAIVMAGATPVFADIDAERLTLDPAAAEEAITSRTAAIMPVHLYGQPADMPAIAAIAQRRGLAIVEDCCQAHLATCGGGRVGTFGAAGAFSFYPTKNLGAMGDGGAIVTGDAALAERARRIRNGGQSDRYHHTEFGINSRLDELQAAVLRARLTFLEQRTTRRRTLAADYRRRLDGSSVQVPIEKDRGHVYHLFPIRTKVRGSLQSHLRSAGIETLVHYPILIPQQAAFSSLTAKPELPRAAAMANETLSLPLYPSMSMEAIERVVTAIHQFAATGEGKERAS